MEMKRTLLLLIFALGSPLFALCFLPTHPACANDDSLPLERVEVEGHPPYDGLIESEDENWITLIQIQRRPGRPMHLVIRTIDRHHATVHHIDPDKRVELQSQIVQFRKHAEIEAGRMDAVSLVPLAADGRRYRHYAGKWFSLDSTADESNTRRVIVRAEQIFAAYRQILPPRATPAKPPRIIVFGSMDDYYAYLAHLKLKIQNRACFLEVRNLVLAGTELTRVSAILAKYTADNDILAKKVAELEKQLSARLRKMSAGMKQQGLSDKEIANALTRERRKFEEQTRNVRGQLAAANRAIAGIFNQNTQQTFVRLYHESFHAYLRNYVYPLRGSDIPYWLNEGLAVMFEGGILEGNTLRIDAPNAAVMKKLKADLESSEPMPLEKLLEAGQREFLLTGEVAPAEVDRYYNYAWGLAYYLTFERRLLGSEEMDHYVAPAKARGNPIQRFERLVGMPLDQFEPQWREYIRALR